MTYRKFQTCGKVFGSLTFYVLRQLLAVSRYARKAHIKDFLRNE